MVFLDRSNYDDVPGQQCIAGIASRYGSRRVIRSYRPYFRKSSTLVLTRLPGILAVHESQRSDAEKPRIRAADVAIDGD